MHLLVHSSPNAEKNKRSLIAASAKKRRATQGHPIYSGSTSETAPGTTFGSRRDVLPQPENPAHATDVSSGQILEIDDLADKPIAIRPELIPEGHRAAGEHAILGRSGRERLVWQNLNRHAPGSQLESLLFAVDLPHYLCVLQGTRQLVDRHDPGRAVVPNLAFDNLLAPGVRLVHCVLVVAG